MLIGFVSCDLNENIVKRNTINGIGRGKYTPSVIDTYYIENFGCVVSDNGEITFSWKNIRDYDYLSVSIKATDGSYSLNNKIVPDSLDSSSGSLTIQGTKGKIYEYRFKPYGNLLSSGKEYRGTCYVLPEDFQKSLPYIVVTTKDGELPNCDYVTHPNGACGEGLENNDYIYVDIKIFDKDGKLLFDSIEDNKTLEGYESKIKIRGNTSAYGDKKPYKIKLNKKTDLLKKLGYNRSGAQYKDKEWILMTGGTSLNNVAGFAVNEYMGGIDYTPAYKYVELYINGDYRGIYMIVESIKQGNIEGEKQARCAVDDDGFVIENDPYWWNEGLFFETGALDSSSHAYTFKFPDADDISEEQILYIKNYVQQFEKDLKSYKSSYLDFIDLDSFVSWTMVHEYLGSYDGAGSNQYIIKKDSTDNTKLEMTTTWDFDGMMNTNDRNKHANINRCGFFFTAKLLADKTFHKACEEKYKSTKDGIISFVNEKIDSLDSDAIDSARKSDSVRWSGIFTSVKSQKQAIENWLTERLLWMESEYGSCN